MKNDFSLLDCEKFKKFTSKKKRKKNFFSKSFNSKEEEKN